MLKDWESKRAEWTKSGEEVTREAYEAIEKETNETEDFSLPRSSKCDIILETSNSTISLGDQAKTFQTHTQYVNSEAVGSTLNFRLRPSKKPRFPALPSVRVGLTHPFLSSFLDVGSLDKNLAPLATVHWEQVETTSQINLLYHEIMSSYNETIQLLSKKFVFWDSLLKLAEQEAAGKP